MVSHPVVLALLGPMALGIANDLGMFHHRNIAHIRSPPLQGGWYTRLDHRIYAVNTSRDSRSVSFSELFEGRMPRELQVWHMEKVLTGPGRPPTAIGRLGAHPGGE